MSIFQKSVINKHLANLDSEVVEKAYQKFRENYNSAKIEEIKNLKEEEYQDGFLRDIFVDVFGYILKPSENYNLAREFKNQGDSKKADGAILKDGKAVAVIELKSTKTKDLKNVTEQAFGYKHNQPDCKYVIISNFQKLQFFIDYANEYEEFDLFHLQKNEFELLYLLLNSESIFADIPQKLKEETKFHEKNISDKLYKDYSLFKDKIFKNLVKNNPQYDKLDLFKKSQKFLDRLLFVFFAEDTGLVPPNAISKIIDQWQMFKDNNEYFTLYSRFIKFFVHLDKEHKYKTYELPAYNGGLFAPDEILDNVTIDDGILKDDALLLSSYDFNTDVDVNILGHIFEHSLSEIEEITAEIEGTATDKKNSKRKNDGVFYTPKYITQYIVENTVGTLCKEKRKEFGIVEIEFDGSYKTKDNTLSVKGKKLFETLEKYKEWLLTLKIVDPACGSGAFLNQALTFLIEEHKQIDDIIAELTGEAMRLYDTDKSILENNLYGVDINEESVEIAKLSLWLRTARKDRKLSNLNSNIKCGNSLIDDPEVAGDKAFNWNKEFSEIMQNGGFDIVIGNPPYVSHDRVDNKEYLKYNFKTYQAFADLFCYFYEFGIRINKPNGILSFITSNSFLRADYGKPLREYFLDNTSIEQIINIEDAQIFSDAIVNSVIVTLVKQKDILKRALIVDNKFNIQNDFGTFIETNKFAYAQTDFDSLSWNLIRPEILKLRNKIKGDNPTLEELGTKIRLGLATGSNDAFIITEEQKNQLIKEDLKSKELIMPMLRGKDIEKYYFNLPNLYLLLTKNGIDIPNEYPAIYNHLDSFGENFKKRGAKGKHWTNLRACSFFNDFQKEKIIWIELTDKGRFSLCEEEIYLLNSAYFLLPPENLNSGYLLSLLNSRVIKFFLKQIANTSGVGTTRWINIYVKEFPICIAGTDTQSTLDELAKKMHALNKQFQQKKNTFLSRAKDNFEIERISKKLDAFYNFDFKVFVVELKKKKINISLIQQDEWEEYFNNYKTELNNLQFEISNTDKEIDQMVYELYGLTKEEIAIVEGEV